MRLYFTTAFLLASFITWSQDDCWLGKTFPGPVMSETTKKNHEDKLAEAEKNYRADSTRAEHIIWLGRRQAYLGHYETAIATFSRGIALHPADARMYRHRGHRYLTLRCFDKAIADFEKAATLIKGKPDEIEPDGIPNAKKIPLSTLQSNIWYHLGLAYFLKADFDKAEAAYREGLKVSWNDDMDAAMINWALITLLSRQKTDQADSLFRTLNPNPSLIENFDYLSLLYFYVHKPAENEIERYTDALLVKSDGKKDTTSVSAATLYFGAGYYARIKGMEAKATLFFQKAKATGQWSSFGYIAAEAMLAKLK